MIAIFQAVVLIILGGALVLVVIGLLIDAGRHR